MIGYFSVEGQVDKDFDRALLKASLRRWKNRLHRDCANERLLSFEEAKGALAQWTQAYQGMRIVEVEKITGSVGRWRDFDESFLPLRMSMGERWSRIDRAYHRGDELPPVELYKIGEAYFVRDGNHRVSVARYHKVATIDAEVVEIRGRTRTDAARRTARMAGNPAHRPHHAPPEPGASPLHNLWHRLRPGLWWKNLTTPRAERCGSQEQQGRGQDHHRREGCNHRRQTRRPLWSPAHPESQGGAIRDRHGNEPIDRSYV